MPRYYFDVYDFLIARDDEGLELATLEEAKAKAVIGARALAAEQVSNGYLKLHHRVDVRDDADRILARIPFHEVIRVEG